MSIHRGHFEEYVVNPAVQSLMLPRPADAAALLMAVAAIESGGGYALHKFHGPEVGPWQMTPAKYITITNLLSRGSRPMSQWRERRRNRDADHMAADLFFAGQMARWWLWFEMPELPAVGDRHGHYEAYLRIWNPSRPPSEEKFLKANDTWVHAAEKA